MAASITMDIQAKIVGYQEAIAKMKAEFAKVDPGSDIGKKLAKAISSAETQLKGLEKNMFPKVSSDTQIDAVIDKVNRVGEALLSVNQLMQQVGAGDLNLDALGGDIQNFRTQIAALQQDLENKLGQGLLEAVKGSEELRAIFKDILGVDVDTAKGSDLFKAIEKGALSAAKATEQAKKALDEAQNKLNENEAAKQKINEGPFGSIASKQQLQDQIRSFQQDYNAVFAEMKDKVSGNLTKVLKDNTNVNQEELLNNFFQGLTPENIRDRLNKMYNVLSEQGIYAKKGQLQDFYKQIFGVEGNYKDVAKTIDFKQADEIKAQFRALIESLTGDITRGNVLKITELINSESIEEAAKKTIQDIERAFSRIQNTYYKLVENTPKLQETVTLAGAEYTAAQEKQQVISNADTTLQNRVTILEKENDTLRQDIKTLNDKIQQLTESNAKNIQSEAKGLEPSIQKNIFPIEEANLYKTQLEQVKAKEQLVGKIQGIVQRWFSIYAAVRMVGQAIRSVIATLKELDATITEIAIVTNMTQDQLWSQMNSYTNLARQYAASISGVYKVSQLYYQQGLQTADVMALTEQTLKMARISGLEYADATDYMTNAVRSFKLEMSDAQVVVDTYSAVAASSATSVTELASAMSKTASSAQSVGASIQNTTAMLAVMIEATRESPENIGSAMKSIISRYGELKENKTGIDAEGEEYSLNKVDKALQSVGISIHDVNGEFRDFDDVIFELASKWDTIDKNTQRYIATIMAGNRQQSRFLALVSSYDRLKELSATAADSEDASQLQFLKTLDSVEAKTQQLQTSIQSLYVSSGLEKTYKTILDLGNSIIKTFEQLGKKNGLGAVIGKIAASFTNTALLVTKSFQMVKQKFVNQQAEMTLKAKLANAEEVLAVKQAAAEKGQIYNTDTQKYEDASWERIDQSLKEAEAEVTAERNAVNERIRLRKQMNKQQRWQKVGMIASAVSGIATTVAASIDVNKNRELKAGLTGAGAALQGLGTGLMVGGWAGGIVGTLSALPGILESVGMLFTSTEEKISKFSSTLEASENKRLKSKNTLKTLRDYEKKYNELSLAQYDSAEAQQEYLNLQNEIAEQYPQLIDYIDEEGNKIVRLGDLYRELIGIKSETYKQDAIEARKDKIKSMNDLDYRLESLGVTNKLGENGVVEGILNGIIGIDSDTFAKKELMTSFKRYGFAGFNSVTAYNAVNDNTLAKVLFNTNTSFNNAELIRPRLEKLREENGNYGISDYWWDEYILGHEEDNGYDLVGKLIDSLMGKSENKYHYGDINSILNDLLAGITHVSLNSELYSYRSTIVNSKKLIEQGGFKEAQIQTKEMFKDLIEQNPGRLNSNLGSAFSQEQFLDSFNQYYEKEKESGKSLEVIWEEFAQDQEKYFEEAAQEYDQALLKVQNKTDRNNLEKIFESITDYDPIEFQELINGINFGENNQELYNYVIEYYNSMIESVQENFIQGFKNSKLKNDIDFDTNEEWLSEHFGSKYLPAILSQYQSIFNSSLDNNIKQRQVSLLDNLYTGINNIEDFDLRTKAVQKVSSANLTSIEGIYDLFESLSDLGIDISQSLPGMTSSIQHTLLELSKTLKINLLTSFESFSKNLITQSQDFDKALSSISSGMDLKAASEMADKLKISLKEFTFKNGKYFYDVIDAPEKIQEAYFKYNDELKQRLDEEFEVFAGNEDKNKKGLLTVTYRGGSSGILDIISEDIDNINRRSKKEREVYWKNLQLEAEEGEKLLDLYNQYYSGWDKQGSFNDYVLKQLTESHDNMTAAIDQYGSYQVNAILLQNGYITQFIENITDGKGVTEAQKALITKAIASGNLDSLREDEELWPLIENYVKVISDTFSNIQTQIGKDLITSLQGGKRTVTVNKNNIEVLQQNKNLFKTKVDEEGNEVEFTENDILTYKDVEDFKNDQQGFYDYINKTYTNDKDRLKALQEFYEAIYTNKLEAVTSLTKESSSVDFAKFSDYLSSMGKIDQTKTGWEEKIKTDAQEYGLKFSELTGKFIIEDWAKYIEKLTSDLGNLNDTNSTLEERNELQAQIDEAKNKQQTNRRKAINNITSNYKELTEDNIKELATAFDLNYEVIKNATIDNNNGTRRLDINSLKTALNYDKLTDVEKESIESLIATISDDYLNAISMAVSYTSKGTTKQADMQKFVNDFNEKLKLTGTENALKITDLFSWDSILEAFTLNAGKLQSYLNIYQQELINTLGMNEEEAKQYIQSQLKELNSIDFTSFLSAENKSSTGKSYKTIRQQMINSLTTTRGILSENWEYYLTEELENWEDIYNSWGEGYQTEQAKEWAQDAANQHNQPLIEAAKAQAEKAAEENAKNIKEAEDDLTVLMSGGLEAIAVMKKYAGDRELTAEEIEAAYRARLNNISNVLDTLGDLQVGNVVDQNTREILKQFSDFSITEDGVVLAVGDLVSAYNKLYQEMKDTAIATTAELNSAYAKVLTAQEQPEIDAISALQNAMGMTYDELGQLLARYGKSLEDEINQSWFQKIGNGKIRITDFTAFANYMQWDVGSEEYLSAFKTYNDSLIELNNKTEKTILDEVKSLGDAKIGDKINLTYLWDIIQQQLESEDINDYVEQASIMFNTGSWSESQEEIANRLATEAKQRNIYYLKQLENEFSLYGATFKDGILTINKNANIQAIIEKISSLAAENTNLLPDQLAELNDVVSDYINNIISLIKNGISGGLKNVDAQKLQSWADQFGLNLDFTQTAEGLKLSQQSAIQLYNALKGVDNIKSKLVFDELNKSLQEANEHYKSISDIANHIAWLDSQVQSGKIDQYSQELALAKEIYAVRSTTEDSSFSFMSNKIPGAQNNPINYYNDWAKAINTFNDALANQGTYTRDGKTVRSGFVDYQYWYNLVTEMNNIAALGGNIEFAGETLDGSLEAASKLIEKGASSLVATDTGEIKVALSGMALNFESGADAFSDDVTKGIKAMAQSQVKMLDGMIQLLETVVAMEKLGDIDSDTNGKIDLTDLFPTFDENKSGQKQKLKPLEGFDAFVKAAGDSLDNIIINNESLSDMIDRAKTKGLDKAEAKNFTAIMDSLYQMYKSGDYNLDNIYDSIQQIMASSKFTGTVQLGDSTLHVKNGAIVIETEEQGKSVYQTPDGQRYDSIDEALARSAVRAQGVKGEITFSEKFGTATGTLRIETLKTDVAIASNSEGELTFNGEEHANINEYIDKWLKEQKGLTEEEKIQKKIDVNFELGVTKLDSFSYRSISDDIKQKLEKALASGKQTEVDAVIKANPVLKQLEGKTGAEIEQLLHLDNIKINIENTEALSAISAVEEELAKLKDKTVTVTTINKTVEQTSGIKKDSNTNIRKDLKIKSPDLSATPKATGTVGLAKAQGTLMGELGPELYVQNGRYFVAGQNGPEFVNLAPDAIVFNHLQTRSLLDKGMSPGRGKAVTNERNAVSYAKGNVNGGPAMASASAALAALKQLRAEWNALMNLGVADLAKKGGGGGGGGDKDLPGFIRDVERWYNWLQKIADLEKQITYQEQLRSKIQSDMVPSGKAYYASLKQTYGDAKDSALTSQSLFLSQKESFNKRREQLNNSPLSELYTFDETGQLHYQKGSFNWLAQLFKTDDFGQLALNPQQQYEMILSRNPEFAQYMKYNSEGKEIKQEDYKDNKDQYYLDMVKAFSDRMDAEKEEMQNLFDSWNDQQKAVLEQMQKMNEQLQAMKDNQKEVEESVLKAIVESRERQIKEMEDTKNALQKTNQDFIDGLSKQLDKEQKMYQNNEKDQELQRNRRQLAILQRSGGSASQISSLQKQIEQQSRDQYFEKQQEQIDAVKEASDLQIERLDHQIEIEQEALEYQKANGLLWSEVYNIMKGTPEQITNFIASNTADFWDESPLAKTEKVNKLIFETEQWTQFRDDTKMQKAAMGRIDQNLDIFLAALEQIYGDQANWEEIKAKATEDYNKYYGIDNNDPNKAAWDSYPGKNDIETKNTGKQTTGTTNTTTTTTNTPNKTTDDEIDRNTISKSWYYDDVKHWKTAYTKDGRKIRVLEDKHVKDKGISDGNRLHYKCKICGCDMGFIYEGMAEGLNKNTVDNGITNKSREYKISRLKSSVKNNNNDIEIIPLEKGVPKAANGAIVDQSGAAIIHDNEVILTAEQTKFLRDDILSNKSTSLLGILSSLHSSYKDISANTINNSEGNVIIENATVQMNVQKIADDYDARRAGDQAMEEMLRIARKSGTRSV